MNDYPLLKFMGDVELVLLHHKVANSREPSDIDFASAVLNELKLRQGDVPEIYHDDPYNTYKDFKDGIK